MESKGSLYHFMRRSKAQFNCPEGAITSVGQRTRRDVHILEELFRNEEGNIKSCESTNEVTSKVK